MDDYFDMVSTSLHHGLRVGPTRAGFRGGGQRAGEGLTSSREGMETIWLKKHRGLNGGTRIRMYSDYSVSTYIYIYYVYTSIFIFIHP